MGVKDFLIPIINTGAPINNIALWFLLTLFLCKILFDLLTTLRVPSVAIGISMGLLAFVAYSFKIFIRDNDVEIPYYIVNTITGVCFYAMGFSLVNLQFKRNIIYISLFAHVIILFAFFSFVDMFKNVLVVGYYPLWLISSVSGCIIINNLFRKLCKHVSFQLLEYVGRNSMVFYAAHLWIIVIVNGRLIPFFGIKNAIVCFMINTVACVIILPMLNAIFRTNKLRWMIGENSN